MKLTDILQEIISEGVYDPGIFKAVFLAGGPGSGKGYVINGIFGVNDVRKFSSTGIKLINSDIAFEKFLSNSGINPKDLEKISKEDPDYYNNHVMKIRDKAKQSTNKIQSHYENGRLGILIDGTGKDVNKIKDQKETLEKLGYDTYLVFVNTSLEVAKNRNRMRDRTIPEDLLEKMWNEVQNNIGKFQSVFGNNISIVDNSQDNQTVDSKIVKKIDLFLKSPIENPIAKQWINKELKDKKRQ